MALVKHFNRVCLTKGEQEALYWQTVHVLKWLSDGQEPRLKIFARESNSFIRPETLPPSAAHTVRELGKGAKTQKWLKTLALYLGAPGLRRARPDPRRPRLCLLGPPGFLSEGFDRSGC